MKRRRRWVWAVGLLLVAYGSAVTLGSYRAERVVAASLVQRLEESLGGRVTVAEVEVSLWRGTAHARGIELHDGPGAVATGEIGQISANFAPGGAVVWTNKLESLRIADARLTTTVPSLWSLKRPRAAKLTTERVVLENVVLRIRPAGWLPEVATGEVRIERAVSGPTALRGALSWLTDVEEFAIALQLPWLGDVSVSLRAGTLAVAGSLVPRALQLHFTLPDVPPEASDGERLKLWVRAIIDAIRNELGAAWLRGKLQSASSAP